MTMIASTQFSEMPGTFEDALARVPARTFGDTGLGCVGAKKLRDVSATGDCVG